MQKSLFSIVNPCSFSPRFTCSDESTPSYTSNIPFQCSQSVPHTIIKLSDFDINVFNNIMTYFYVPHTNEDAIKDRIFSEWVSTVLKGGIGIKV